MNGCGAGGAMADGVDGPKPSGSIEEGRERVDIDGWWFLLQISINIAHFECFS